MHIIKKLLAMFCLLFAVFASAASIAQKCDAYVTNTTPPPVILTATAPTVYVFENTSDQAIWLNRATLRDPGASAGWASQIMPGHYSAFTLAEDCFPLTCSTMGNNGVTYLPCHQVIDVYAYPMNNRAGNGGYWLVENKSMDDIKQALQQLQNG